MRQKERAREAMGGGEILLMKSQELREIYKEKRHREVGIDGWRKRRRMCWD